MNKAQAKIAIDALRSGAYEQARDTIGLYGSNRLCCIGVAAKANGAPYFHDTQGPTDFLKLTSSQRCKLVDMNDNKGKTFAEIADWMEGQTWDDD